MIFWSQTIRSGLAGLAVSMLTISVAEAATVDVEVDGIIYEIGTRVGTFADLESELTSQPFWNNEALATDLAEGLGDGLGTPNFSSSTAVVPLWGPFFAFEPFADIAVDAKTFVFGSVSTPAVLLDAEATYAVAERPAPIPVPPAAALLLGGLGALGLVKRRRA
mgnify:CR=1 FL=1